MGPVALKVLLLLDMPRGEIACAAIASTASGAEPSVIVRASAEDAIRLAEVSLPAARGTRKVLTGKA